MKKYIRNKYIFILFLLLLLFLFLYLNQHFRQNQKEEEYDKLSIIVNMKHLTKEKHLLYYEVMKELNSKRNYYFIKNVGRPLNENLNELV